MTIKQAGRAPEVHLPSGLGVGELSSSVREHFEGQILSMLMLRLDRALVLTRFCAMATN